jgi:membrane protease YdiL (CAAX protease family)
VEEPSTEQPSPSSPNFVVGAALIEGLLGGLAIVLGGWLGYPPAQMIHWTVPALLWGLAASLPMAAFLWVCHRFPIGPLGDLLRVVDELLAPLFRHCTTLELALLALIAGFSEEPLFRGLIQSALSDGFGGGSWGVWTALAVASLLFGLAHFITYSYLVMAALMGLYLGWLWIESGNLLIPIIAHALYDFLALLYVVRKRARP